MLLFLREVDLRFVSHSYVLKSVYSTVNCEPLVGLWVSQEPTRALRRQTEGTTCWKQMQACGVPSRQEMT